MGLSLTAQAVYTYQAYVLILSTSHRSHVLIAPGLPPFEFSEATQYDKGCTYPTISDSHSFFPMYLSCW